MIKVWSVFLLISLMSILCFLGTCIAEVGTPCPVGDECEPGEICAPGRIANDPSFCTRSCNSDRPCPEDYICEPRGGISLCNTPISYAQLGEACNPSCAEGLLCVDDGVEEYCSSTCTLPGSCPLGFSCRPGALNACAKITTAPSIGEPCNEESGCSGDYECLMLPHRELTYCTYPCAEINCPSFMSCEGDGEEARCVHLPYSRSLGEECVSEAFDPSTIGCDEPFTCERDNDRRRCTQDCSVDMPCPEGFGCVNRPETPNLSIGRCMPDVEDDPDLAPFESQGGVLEGGTDEEITPPLPEEENAPVGVYPSQSGDEDTGCSSKSLNQKQLPFPILVLFIILSFIHKRSREMKSL